MGQQNTVLKQSIKHVGYWKYSELYAFCFDWLKDNGYKIKENEYTEKITGFGKELIIDWEASQKVTDYFRYLIKVRWHILGMIDAEIEKEGKKVSTNKGEVKITIEGILEKDYEKKWEDKPIWKFLRGIYEKYIIRTTIDEYEDRIRDDAKQYVSEIKSFLQLGK